METGLRDRVAIVAAASQGMGRAAAQALAREGAHLAICARNTETLAQAAAEIRSKSGVEVHAEALDLRNSEAVTRFVDNTARRFGRLDVCVTNAGGPPAKSFLETTEEDWMSAFALNLHSVVTFARAVIPFMQQRQWGRIITISSITVREPQPGLILSNGIRPGVMGLVRTLATDLGPDGILVNNVAPGYIATDRTKNLHERQSGDSGQTVAEIEKRLTDQIPLRRLGSPEEIANTIVWLASERASFITGQTILVDGGMYKGL